MNPTEAALVPPWVEDRIRAHQRKTGQAALAAPLSAVILHALETKARSSSG